MNAVVFSVVLMLGLSLMRVNVVIALTLSSLIGGAIAGLSLSEIMEAFNKGLGGGATIALSYAMLGAFAVAISKSGITDILAKKIIRKMGKEATPKQQMYFKGVLLTTILLAAIASQNLVPVHIAFIPILIPPLLHTLAKFQIDRRLVACVIAFGLTATYMLIPVGFGGIFLNNILMKNIIENGVDVTLSQMPLGMAIPVFGMFLGLLVAVFISYRKPRKYCLDKILATEPEIKSIRMLHVGVALCAIIVALCLQVYSDSIILGSLAGLSMFILGGVVKPHETHDVFSKGVVMMGMIGFIMIAASGFSEVMKATHGVAELVNSTANLIGDNRSLAAFMMLIVGLLITMGIGSSFSTIPIIATIYVPLCIHFGFSPLATIAIVGAAAALGDAGSPASDTTLGPTSGLAVDGQHDHIWDTVVPTFIHYNIPLIIFGWIAAMVL